MSRTGRYICTTASGQPVVHTDDPAEAARYQHVLKGRVIDRHHPSVQARQRQLAAA